MIERDYGGISLEDLKKEDKFERYKYLPTLENLILSKTNDSFVLQISGQYGSGKTFFVNLLRKYLQEKGFSALYYNSWEHDYAQDAFISFCSTFIKHFDDSPDSAGFKAATKKLIVNNIPAMLKYGFKAVIEKYTGADADVLIDTVCGFAQDVDNNSQQIQKACNDLLDTELEREGIIKEFRNQLEKLIDASAKQKPLIVFIDDLDRCKADFAVRLLDYIKHLFNIRGITFILAVDDEQLKSTIQHFYGAQNASGYLKRIVDFDFHLPLGNYKKYICSLIKEYKLSGYIANDYFVNLLNNLGFIFDLSLRDFNQIFLQIHKIMNGYSEYDHWPYMYFTAYIIKHYFYKYQHEIALLETEDSKKLSDSQKLVYFFNHKFAHNTHYTNSLQYDAPLNSDSRKDYNLQEVMSRMVQIPSLGANIPCYNMFPPHLVRTNNYDPYQQKTVYEKIWAEIDEILGEAS